MTSELPLGMPETATVEFKSRLVLQDLSVIGRSVVAFLNARGGALWIGIAEVAGRGAILEAIADPDRESRRIQDYLVDTIEPSLTTEVTIEVVQQVLRLSVKPLLRHQPYAFLKQGGARYFLIRVRDRTRLMTHDEIFRTDTTSNDASLKARSNLHRLWNRAAANSSPALWMGIKPVGDLSLDLDSETLTEVLQDPSRSGNRRNGWLCIDGSRAVQVRKGSRSVRREDGRFIQIDGNGTFTSAIPLAGLHWKGEPQLLWPYAIVEYPVSVLRVFAVILNLMEHKPVDELLIAVALFQLRGWRLGAGSPDSIDYMLLQPATYEDEELDPTWTFKFPSNELASNPDRFGLRVVCAIYEAFGYGSKNIIGEYNQQSEKLVLPG